MTASMPPSAKSSLSINIGITRDRRDCSALRNKGRTNYTVGCFYSAPGKDVSGLRGGSFTPIGASCSDDFSEHCTIRASLHGIGITPVSVSSTCTNKNELQVQPSPQSVTFNSHPPTQATSAFLNINNINTNTTKTTDTTTPRMEKVNSDSLKVQPLPKSPTITTTTTTSTTTTTTNAQLTKIERTYDMNLVPKVKKNREFLYKWRETFTNKVTHVPNSPSSFSLPGLVSCDISCGDLEAYTDLVTSNEKGDSDNACSNASESDKEETRTISPCHSGLQTETTQEDADTDNPTRSPPSPLSPFASDCESVIWVPDTRAQWEDCIDEMVAVCTAAAWHKHRSGRNVRKKKDFPPPISKLYIDERVKIDDPLHGYQIRHKTGGWLQGFVMMTTFTVWTHYFKWDNSHSANGIDQSKPNGMVDDGTLATELENQSRSGNPNSEGVVWDKVAEMSLVGGLGCGEYLLQMALDDITKSGVYDYVVLEATETSRPFYEKFGFVRVGAICKYGKETDFASQSQDIEIVGYRHWTYPESTVENLSEHGLPSCMMARKVTPIHPKGNPGLCEPALQPSFIDELSPYFVLQKPEILTLGSPGRKRSMSGASTPTAKSTKTAKNTTPSRVTSSGRKSKAPSRLDESVDMPVLSSRRTQNTRTSRNSAASTLSPAGSIAAKPRKKSCKSMPLRKQRIPSMYRSPNKLYFYNKVVTPKSDDNHSNVVYKSKYYFVINYDIETKEIRIIPLFLKGTFKGKREGRSKWKANVLERQETLNEQSYLETMDVITSPCSNWDIVESYAVTKCASVKDESWDVLV